MSSDLYQRLDPRRRQWLVVSVLVLLVLLLILAVWFYERQRSQKPPPVAEQSFRMPRDIIDPEEDWIAARERQLEDIGSALMSMEEGQRSLKGDLRSLREKHSQLLTDNRKLQSEVSRLQRGVVQATKEAGSQQKEKASVGNALSNKRELSSFLGIKRTIQKVSFKVADNDRGQSFRELIPAGTFARAVMLSGLDAPTGTNGRSNPLPVLLQLYDQGSLPNNYSHRIRSCRLVVAAWGNASSERAEMRLERLSCLLRHGGVISVAAKGWVVGEDGKAGILGRLVTRQGAFLANSFSAGLIGGLGSAFSAGNSSQLVSTSGSLQTIEDSKVYEYALGQGLGKAGENLAEWYLERADELYPVIEVPGGAVVDVVFSEDVSLNKDLITEHSP